MKIKIPKDVEELIEEIYNNGYEAFIVGGCVRDSVIGLVPNDYDITTNATPNEIINIFKNYKVIETGIKHGTVTIIKNKSEYEITTYRIDGEYKDNRRPDKVEFTSNIKKDLERRDFTINAIAYNSKVGLVDEFEGIRDINKKLIKTVGSPEKRFKEDGLRIIRAVRFSAKLAFEIDKNTMEAIYKNINLISGVSYERIQEEINKILLSDNPEKIYILYDAGIFDVLNLYDINIEENKLNKLKVCNKDLILRLSIFTYLMGDTYKGKQFLKLLKYSNNIRIQCEKIIENIDIDLKKSKKNVKKYLNKFGKINFMYILKINEILNNKDNTKIYEIIDEVEKNNECYELKSLSVNGNDLKALGYKGKDIGIKLNALLELVIENSELNDKLKLIEMINDTPM
ncbi:CCA tRNA nucleotidyltransferase [Paraclostridium sordellii]|uniref:CCA tRNA nucleotidyltransferase n=1 Tax=Paraclostridium sordellii TaxID=1505 RepID=UPI001C616A95|nr:CCA tRNA nucleotidyltransferase [Paeniclostridium sordellii]QYE97467.1 CCA tRNA nucleotidyltransferase [Paeniclostridium sordellii]